ncbi:MAG: phosphotyrosine protein phosphatase [Eubacterium sp.]|nr:phosphotyrosine protein phosphatase [Eubacterium sp.]
MSKYSRVLFVSEADTGKGPMAAAAFSQYMATEDVEVDSRGMVVLFPEPINEKAEAVMVSNGLSQKDHRAKAITEDDFQEGTAVIALERDQYEALLDKFSDSGRVFLLEELIGEPVDYGVLNGKELSDYGRCFERIRDHMRKLAEYIRTIDKVEG